MVTRLIFASKNAGKLKEIQGIFRNSNVVISSLLDYPDCPDIIEDGNSFEANAIIKAKFVFDRYGGPVIADDSGISMDQLNKAPGIHSARYAGKRSTDLDNNLKLQNELRQFPKPHTGGYVCCAVYYDGIEHIVSFGELRGEIIEEPRGTNGFGYDPYFVPDGYTQTMSELGLEEKNKISHRGKAFRDLQKELFTRG